MSGSLLPDTHTGITLYAQAQEPPHAPEPLLLSPEGYRQEIPVKRLDTLDGARAAQLPSRAHNDDAGYDLYCSQDLLIGPGEFVDVPTGVAVGLPEWGWGFLTGRSSTLRKHGLLVHTGIIDPGYQGELFAGVWNLGRESTWVREGDRLAQLIIIRNDTALTTMRWLDPESDFTPTERGTAGFGSSGR